MTSHWPTFADGLFWCACDNRTFDSEEAWQAHVVDSVNEERGNAEDQVIEAAQAWRDGLGHYGSSPTGLLTLALIAAIDDYQPFESSVRHDAPSR